MTKAKGTTEQQDPQDPFDKADAKGKLELLIPLIKTGFPNMLAQNAKASDNAIENLKLCQTIETKITEFLKYPQIYLTTDDNKKSIALIGELNKQIATEIVKEHEKDIKQHEQNTNAQLSELITTVKRDFPDAFPKEAKVSENVSENLKISTEIGDKCNKLNFTSSNTPDEQKILNAMNTANGIKQEYKLLQSININQEKDRSMKSVEDINKLTINTNQEKDQSVKKAKSMGQRIKAAPSKLINKARKKVNNILGR